MTDEEIIRTWFDAVQGIPVADYVPFRDAAAVPPRLRAESQVWCQRFFTAEANPYRAENKARHSYYRAGKEPLDLLRHDYKVAEIGLSVKEGANFTLISAVPLKPDEMFMPGGRAIIENTARAIINLADREHLWDFEYPPVIVDGAIISTDSAASLFSLPEWGSRADVVIGKKALHFFCYKRYPPKMGFRDSATWFGDAIPAKPAP
jgi:hypothetical protein